MAVPTSNPDALPHYDHWLTRHPGTALAFFWGFAEATLFFILPDVLLSFVALFRPRRAVIHIGAIVAGALLGGALMFVWSENSAEARHVVARVPAVMPGMFEQAERDLRNYGIRGTSLGPVRGIPYKVYAVAAPEYSALLPFLLWTIPARLWRLVVVWLGFAAAGIGLRRINRASLAPLLHGAFWCVTYAIYWTNLK